MLIDSHCHLNFPDFAAEIDAVVARARAVGVGRMVTISTRVKKHTQVLGIAEKFPDVFCSVGTHPHHAHEELDIDAAALGAISQHPKVVAIGEAGLDYHYDTSPRDAQEQGFRQHIAAARETGLPLVIHSREADADMARILKEETGKGAFPAVLHCFTCARSLRHCRPNASLWKRILPTSPPRSIAAGAASRPTSLKRPRFWPRRGA
jgi:TatD DNase family protein